MNSIYILIITALALTANAHAPMSKPDVSQVCVSAEEKKVSCSLKGDDLEFNWQLTMTTSTGQTLYTGTGSATSKHVSISISISLHGQLVGNLTCVVQNSENTDSESRQTIQLTACGAVSWPVGAEQCFLLVGLISGPLVLILLMTLLLLLCRYRSSKGRQGTNQGSDADQRTNTNGFQTGRSMTRLQHGNTDVQKPSDDEDYVNVSADIHAVQDQSEDYENVKPPATTTKVLVSPPLHVSSAAECADIYSSVLPKSLRSPPSGTRTSSVL